MDSRIGLDYIVENEEYVAKLGTALDTNNATVKKQVFELLSALCAYNPDGYARAIEVLEHYKNLKGERYRFKIVINELDTTTNSFDYKAALLAFINCIIISASSLQDRLRIRNEFIGLKLLPVLSNLRRIASQLPDIVVQLDVFDEQRECDEAQSLQGPDGINLNSHLDVFYAILGQVAETPQEIPFLSILQHLLRIDPKEAISDIIWDTTETLVHRSTLLENRDDSARLLRAPSVQKFTCPHCRGDGATSIRKQSMNQTAQGANPAPVSSTDGPPPPPPPPMMGGNPPPPPPPMMMKPNGPGLPPPPPVPPPFANKLSASAPDAPKRPITPEPFENNIVLPQQEIPQPKSKMKTINWNKIPVNKVVGKNNIWTMVANSHQDSPMTDLDWTEMEDLFCQQNAPNAQGSPKLSGIDTIDRKSRKENSEITLLDGKRSLNVNIFLKQFRSSNEDIITLIRDGEHDTIGAEKLRGLLKILPEVDELDMLKNFNGDVNRLGNAEKFLLQLIKVSNYKLRIESMLLKEEFGTVLGYLEPNISAIIFAGQDLMSSTLLREVLYMVVVAGNFLNAGGYAGNAVGVKLSSLQKLTDIRANKPGMNLIHYVALQAEKKNKELLNFPEQLSTLENASKTTVEQISNEINALDVRIKKLKKQIELPSTDHDIKDQMEKFINETERDVTLLQRDLKEVDAVRIKLAEFFCEDVNTFKLEECFKIFQNFSEKFKFAVIENEKRRYQEEQAILRRKQREEQLARRNKTSSQAGTPVSDSENCLLMDPSHFDPRASPALNRRRFGSFHSSGENSLIKEDGASPDVTPTGSLRRRRSRALPEEDDGTLMDFLRSSGQDRERKPSSYGSLDRSWARRARSGSNGRKRPELLSIDFGNDRERAGSPSPLTENKPITETEETKPRISREWRQKIESWLQSNDQEDRPTEELKRSRSRRLPGNKRSFENDNDDRTKLDPLPEEKPTGQPTTDSQYKRVYPDWRPATTLDKTDIANTIEAIEGARQSPQDMKDKSIWRKSNLNTANSSEKVIDSSPTNSTGYSPLYMRQRSRETDQNQLTSIVEEDRNKKKTPTSEPNDDKLKIYINRPLNDVKAKLNDISTREKSMSPTSPTNGNSKSRVNSPTNRSDEKSDFLSKRRYRNNNDDETHNKVEIDSDNIETPPTVRRVIHPDSRPAPTPCRRLQLPHSPTQKEASDESNKKTNNELNKQHKQVNPPEQEVLGDGQFDRFSSARRTRRFKRQDNASGTEDNVKNSPSPTEFETVPAKSPRSPTSKSFDYRTPTSDRKSTSSVNSRLYINNDDDQDIRLKKWQDRLKNNDKEDIVDDRSTNRMKPNVKVITKMEKIGRNISSINQEDVREAIRNLKSPTETPERVWSPPRETQKQESKYPIIKLNTHELNDEGFEETQSLVSDTPSHGKESTSSCTDNIDSKLSSKHRPIRMTSTDSTTSSEASKLRTAKISSKPDATKAALQDLIERNRISLERSRSMRGSPLLNTSSPIRASSLTPKRSSSLRKVDSQGSVGNGNGTNSNNKRDVERSGSRTSLRSSRSSLNSAVSTNTVKRVPLKSSSLPPTELAYSSLTKKPLTSQNNLSAIRTKARVPASRSSSSGSSIGPSIRRPPIRNSPASISTSFKENQTLLNGNRQPAVMARSSLLGSRSTPPANSVSSIQPKNTSFSSRVSGFMRPTASSATKSSGTKGK